jgi:hypothetical protein
MVLVVLLLLLLLVLVLLPHSTCASELRLQASPRKDLSRLQHLHRMVSLYSGSSLWSSIQEIHPQPSCKKDVSSFELLMTLHDKWCGTILINHFCSSVEHHGYSMSIGVRLGPL